MAILTPKSPSAACTWKGEVSPLDDMEAAEWYHKAAEQGDASGQSCRGVMYANGCGVPQDYAKAAEQGHAGTQFNLGVMYNDGLGMLQEYV
jgi:uncharacterized protein